MTAIGQDIRQALRLFVRSPRFVAIAIATLALGIGANTAMFSVVNAVLLKPLPFAEPERLMFVRLLTADRDVPGAYRELPVWSYPKYRRFVEDQQAFDDLALFANRTFSIAGDGVPQRVQGEIVTERYPGVLGVNPTLGRTFSYDEANVEGATPVAMIGHALWTERYGADPAIVGRTIEINATPHVVVGVLPPGFTGLSGASQLWVPLATLEPEMLSERWSHSYSLIARRMQGVSEEAAIASVRVTGDRIGAEFLLAGEDAPGSATAASLAASRADADVRRASLVLLGAVGFVLLIACVNLTHLLLARALERRREVAVRVALGASRGRIGRQFFIESILLAAFGALAGLLLARLLLDAAAALLPDPEVFFRTAMAPGAPRIAGAPGLTRIGAEMIGLDAATLLFTLSVTIVTAGLVGIVPAVKASALRPIETLKGAGSAVGSRGRRDFGARATPLIAQIALSLVLLAGAGLMVRSAAALYGTEIGVDAANLVTVSFNLPDASYGSGYDSDRGRAFYAQLMERVRALPGIDSAGMGSCAPISGGCNGTRIEFIEPHREGDGLIGVHWATPDYFATLGLALLEGRGFSDADRAGQPRVVLINEAAARAYWPNESPLGKTVGVWQGGFQEGAEVIGVVADARYREIGAAAAPDVYLPLAQSYRSSMHLFVRSRLPLQSLVNSLSGEVRALDPTLPLAGVKTMETRFGEAMWRTRVGAWLLSAFAGLALLLTAIGIFGVTAQAGAQRTAEIGVRMALGADPRDLLRWMLRQAALVTVAGLAVGVACALALTRLIGAMLYGVKFYDPLTFGAVAALLGLVVLAAAYVPAKRATRVDVLVALRSE